MAAATSIDQYSILNRKRSIIFIILAIVMFCLFNIGDYSYFMNSAQFIIIALKDRNRNNQTINISFLQNTKLILNEPCYSSNQNISLLPFYNDPQTKIMRTTILKHISPPLLISCGGSGNTFTRLLIEYLTKIYTGSIYTGEFKELQFVGSWYCVTETIVVKFHGEHMRDSNLNPFIQGKCLCGCTGNEVNEPHPVNISIEEFEAINGKINNPAAIFIIRNPWDVFFALYQYWGGNKGGGMRHKSHINLARFNVQDFRKEVSNFANRWNKNIMALQKFKDTNTSHLIITFENLVHKDYDIKTQEVLKIMKFLYRDEYYKEHQDLFKHRLDCLWNISKTDQRLSGIHRDKPNEKELNKTFAYKSMGVESICNVWNKLKPFAKPFGYSIYNNISCS